VAADHKAGLIVFAHGSSVEEANEAVRHVARRAAQLSGFDPWSAAFLELAQPDLAAAVEDLLARGAGRIVVTPYFLTMGIHLQRDLPKIAGEVAARHPGLEIVCTEPLDGHPALEAILAERALGALKK